MDCLSIPGCICRIKRFSVPFILPGYSLIRFVHALVETVITITAFFPCFREAIAVLFPESPGGICIFNAVYVFGNGAEHLLNAAIQAVRYAGIVFDDLHSVFDIAKFQIEDASGLRAYSFVLF